MPPNQLIPPKGDEVGLRGGSGDDWEGVGGYEEPDDWEGVGAYYEDDWEGVGGSDDYEGADGYEDDDRDYSL
jgi:hypothetical protein